MEIIKISDSIYFEEISNLFIQNIEYHQNFDKIRYKLNKKDLTEYKEHIKNTLKNKEVIIYVLKQDKKVIGFITGKIDRDYLIIGDLIIDENYRGGGNGKKLVDAILKYAKKNNVKEVFVSVHSKNKNAIDFYHSFKFENLSIKMNLNLNNYK